MANSNPSPVRTKSGKISCPRCETELASSRSVFFINDEYVGKFESLECPICHYYVLTANGYDEAIATAEELGLIGPQEDKSAEVRIKGRDVIEEKTTINNAGK